MGVFPLKLYFEDRHLTVAGFTLNLLQLLELQAE
jgi:hypothetical protein